MDEFWNRAHTTNLWRRKGFTTNWSMYRWVKVVCLLLPTGQCTDGSKSYLLISTGHCTIKVVCLLLPTRQCTGWSRSYLLIPTGQCTSGSRSSISYYQLVNVQVGQGHVSVTTNWSMNRWVKVISININWSMYNQGRVSVTTNWSMYRWVKVICSTGIGHTQQAYGEGRALLPAGQCTGRSRSSISYYQLVNVQVGQGHPSVTTNWSMYRWVKVIHQLLPTGQCTGGSRSYLLKPTGQCTGGSRSYLLKPTGQCTGGSRSCDLHFEVMSCTVIS